MLMLVILPKILLNFRVFKIRAFIKIANYIKQYFENQKDIELDFFRELPMNLNLDSEIVFSFLE